MRQIGMVTYWQEAKEAEALLKTIFTRHGEDVDNFVLGAVEYRGEEWPVLLKVSGEHMGDDDEYRIWQMVVYACAPDNILQCLWRKLMDLVKDDNPLIMCFLGTDLSIELRR